jgi:hypothetical protein
LLEAAAQVLERDGLEGFNTNAVAERAGVSIGSLYVVFPGGVPQLAVHPGDAGDKALGLDGAQNRSGLGINPQDLPAPILPEPERSFSPGQPRTAVVGRRIVASTRPVAGSIF